MKYSLFESESGKNITVLLDGELYPANSEHPHFDAILAKVRMGDTNGLADLFNPAVTVERKFTELGERVSVRGGSVFFDGEPVNNVLTNQIMRFLQNGQDDWRPLVAFYDKVMTNLDEHTREHLYRWISDRDFEIDEDGDFYAYKGLNSDFTSINQGYAVVDGQEVNGAIPNNEGSTVSMPKNMVEANSAVGCSTGLHAGTWEYAKDFSQGVVVKVKINPRDVVSVPTDCADQKLRVCRYLVTEEVEAKSDVLVSSYVGTYGSDYDYNNNYYYDDEEIF